MMGMPATMMLVSIVFLFCLGARFVGHLGLVYLPCCKKYQQRTTEQLTFLALDDARRFFHTQYVVFELNLIFVLTVLTSLSRCTSHPDGVMRYDVSCDVM